MEVNSLPIHEQSYYWRSLFATIGPRVVGVAVAGLGAGFIGRRCGIEPLYATLIGGGVGSLAALTLDLHKGGRLEAIRRIAEAKRSKAHYLNLSDLGLTSLPAEIGDLTEIRTLILRNNALRELPASMGKLTQLEWLDLGHNSLTALPTFVCQLSQLQYLILEYNQLRKVPGEIGQLLQLECLFLNSNRIEELPIAFGQLARLQAYFSTTIDLQHSLRPLASSYGSRHSTSLIIDSESSPQRSPTSHSCRDSFLMGTYLPAFQEPWATSLSCKI